MSVRNQITLIGNVGQAPESQTLPSGTVLTTFSLATNDYYRDKEGNRQTQTEWHKVKAFGKTAEILAQYLDKGSQVAIVGKVTYNNWIDKHDQKRTTAEIIVNEFTFLGEANTGGRANSAPTTKPEPKKKAVTAEVDDDLPF